MKNVHHTQEHGHDDFAPEIISGVPELLPEGETILWRGSPQFKGILLRVMHVRAILVYFALLALWTVYAGRHDGLSLGGAMELVIGLIPAVILACGLLAALAWGYARTTSYVLTNKRLVITSGIALSAAVNIPFDKVTAAGARLFNDGTADLPLELAEGERPAWIMLWPSVRPWRFKNVSPMLRSIPQGERVALLLASTLKDYKGAGEMSRPTLGKPVRHGRPAKADRPLATAS